MKKNRKIKYSLPDLVILLIVVGFSSYMYFQARGFKRAAVNLTMIGPLYFVLLAFALFRLIQGFRRSELEELSGNRSVVPERIKKWFAENRPLVVMMAASVVYAAGLKFIGFYITTLIVLPLVMYLLGVKKIWLLGAVTAGTLLFFFLSFGLLLKVRLP